MSILTKRASCKQLDVVREAMRSDCVCRYRPRAEGAGSMTLTGAYASHAEDFVQVAVGGDEAGSTLIR